MSTSLKLYGCFIDEKTQCLMYSVPCPLPLLNCAEDLLFDFPIPLADLQLMDVTLPPGDKWASVQTMIIPTEVNFKELLLVMARFNHVCTQCRPGWPERVVDVLQRQLFLAAASPSDLVSVLECDDCLTQMKHTFERVLNSELLGLHLLMTEEDVARIVACEHAAEQEPHNRRLEREDCPPIWRRDLDRSRRDLDRTLHPPPPSPYYTDDDPIQEGPDSDTTMVPSHWLENTVYTQEYLIHDSLPNCFTPPGRETYQTACAVHTTPKLTPSPELTPSQLPITSSPFDLMADVLVEAITAALLFLPSKATRSEVKAIGVEHRQVGVIVRWPFK